MAERMERLEAGAKALAGQVERRPGASRAPVPLAVTAALLAAAALVVSLLR